jgi:plastocyanin
MDQHNEHAAHAEHEGHYGPVTESSVWSLVTGAAAVLLGAVILWWSTDRSNDFAQPLLGATLLATLVAAFAWLVEDSRIRQRGLAARGAPARFTQVVTFAVAEGQLDAARADGGVIAELDHSDNALRALAGFQDLRIIVSPTETGPSQVLVETTWSGRQELVTYEETRRTILDLLGRHPDEVVPGSVQVFDMEVVRDTKEVSVRFGYGAAAAVLAGLVIGGFMVGAGLAQFKETTVVAEGGGGATVVDNTIIATDNKFNKTALEAPPNTEVSFVLKNNGQVLHNLHFYDKKGGSDLAPGAGSSDVFLAPGKSETLTFTTPAAGTYYFQCDIHPTEMFGTFTVREGAPVPGSSVPATGGETAAASSVTVTATDNKYDKTSITAPANADFTVILQNKGQIKHNIRFLDKKGGNTLVEGAGSDSVFLDPGKSETLKFKTPGPGTYYYQCDLHPTEMFGTFTVR